MSDASLDPTDHMERKEGAPDFFRYYIRQVQNVYSQEDDILSLCSQHSMSSTEACPKYKVDSPNSHFSNVKEAKALFSDGVGYGLSDFKRERLNSSLKQSVTVLGQEVDEMVDPVLNTYQLKSRLEKRERLPSKPNSSHRVVSHSPCKKQRIFSPSSTAIPSRAGIVGPPSCEEEDEDWATLLENGGPEVKELVKKHSDGLYTTLENMEQKLEELLDVSVSKCSQMTIAEKQQLRKLIQNLPPKNLDRVVEIAGRNKLPKGGTPCKEVHIDLEKEDNVTLWRLYYYVRTVESAIRLSSKK